VFEPRFFHKALEYLDSEDVDIKIAVLNLIQNLVLGGTQFEGQEKFKKSVQELGVPKKLESMLEKEKDRTLISILKRTERQLTERINSS